MNMNVKHKDPAKNTVTTKLSPPRRGPAVDKSSSSYAGRTRATSSEDEDAYDEYEADPSPPRRYVDAEDEEAYDMDEEDVPPAPVYKGYDGRSKSPASFSSSATSTSHSGSVGGVRKSGVTNSAEIPVSQPVARKVAPPMTSNADVDLFAVSTSISECRI